jgi:hypothetical protein
MRYHLTGVYLQTHKIKMKRQQLFVALAACTSPGVAEKASLLPDSPYQGLVPQTSGSAGHLCVWQLLVFVGMAVRFYVGS